MGLVSQIRAFVAPILVGLATAGFGLAAVFFSFVSASTALRVAHAWARLCLRLVGVQLEIIGREHIDPCRQYVIMANHESSLDICSLLAALPSDLNIRFLAKESLFGVPFLGWAMKALRFIPVNREEGRTAIATLNSTIDEIQHGGSPLVFPEQTWTHDGRLLPFQRGGFLIAIRTHLPILPIGLEGPRLLLPPGSKRPKPGRIIVKIGEPIPTGDLKVSGRQQLTLLVRRTIDELRGPSGHITDSPDQ
ncbi:MAG: 1-acyl-sn-glycerol-3-phosphate acyltransferase [bacterium]|nr:1-acyl-sn-glycerol-3-phosphate acyltransferase [bacterium]